MEQVSRHRVRTRRPAAARLRLPGLRRWHQRRRGRLARVYAPRRRAHGVQLIFQEFWSVLRARRRADDRGQG
jgi:hypothetical protein